MIRSEKASHIISVLCNYQLTSALQAVAYRVVKGCVKLQLQTSHWRHVDVSQIESLGPVAKTYYCFFSECLSLTRKAKSAFSQAEEFLK